MKLPCQDCSLRPLSGSCSFRRLTRINLEAGLIWDYIETPKIISVHTSAGTIIGDPEEARVALCCLIRQHLEQPEPIPIIQDEKEVVVIPIVE